MSSSELPVFSPLAYAYGTPEVAGRYRATPDDFRVDEVLGFEPQGEGEHLWLHVRKRGQNTEWVAKQLAVFAGVKPMDVGYSGMKDRHAVTSQWFSIHLPVHKPQPDWQAFQLDGVELLSLVRHNRKLRTGTHRNNRFTLVIRELQGESALWEGRLRQIAERGVPNYFGEQRFGRDEGNLAQAWAMFTEGREVRDRHKRGLYLSAARSMLFNQYLSRRVAEGCWDSAIEGDAMMLNGSRSFFVIDAVDEVIAERLARWDIHPAGPMWGKGDSTAKCQALAHELALAEQFAPWCEGLARAGLDFERRALRLRVEAMHWQWLDDDLQLSFELDRGSFATSVLRELMGE